MTANHGSHCSWNCRALEEKKTLLFNILLENSGVYKQGIIDKVNWLTQSHNIYSKFNKTVTKLFEVLVKKNPGRLFAMKWSCAISWKNLLSDPGKYGILSTVNSTNPGKQMLIVRTLINY